MRLVASLLVCAFALPLQAEEKVLNLYNWADYVPQQALQRFQAETGIRVKYDSFDSTEVLESKLLTGAVATTRCSLPPACWVGPSRPRRCSPSASWPTVATSIPSCWPSWRVSTPAMPMVCPTPGARWAWGSTARPSSSVCRASPDSLDLLFKPEYGSKLKDCGISVLDSPQEVIAVVLNYLGKDPYSTAEADREAAKALLAQLQPNLRYVGQSRQIDDLAKGEICLALTYTGDAGMAAARASEAQQPFSVVYRIPARAR